ncbi:hypothetical protein [Haloarchaeobius sp. DFWS5]|uniref:hypothetical protein n=1 Tax=Haloarchaeobius sp. DFWS5 TaxID=3446114 RepID=UPI003EC13D21
MTLRERVDRIRVFVLLLVAFTAFSLVGLVFSLGIGGVVLAFCCSLLVVYLWERRRITRKPTLAGPMTEEEEFAYAGATLEAGLTFCWLVVLFVGFAVVLSALTTNVLVVLGGALALSFASVFWWQRRVAIRTARGANVGR